MERDNPVRICLFLFSLPLRKAIVPENLIDPLSDFLFANYLVEEQSVTILE